MGIRDRLKKLAREAEREMVTFELEDGTIARFYEHEHMECFLHECARGRRHYFGEDPGPAHPMVEALRKVSDEELARIMSEHGTMLGQLVGEDQIMRGERASRAAGSGDLSGGVRMSLKRRLEGLEERLDSRHEPFEDAASREVIRRMTTEELREYRDALKRHIQAGEPVEEDVPIWHRRQQLYEEVSGEHPQTA